MIKYITIERKNEQKSGVYWPTIEVEIFPKKAPQKKERSTEKYLIRLNLCDFFLKRIKLNKLDETFVKFPVHIVVEYGLPFKYMKLLV